MDRRNVHVYGAATAVSMGEDRMGRCNRTLNLFFTALLALLSSPGVADTIYVDNAAGDDRNDGTTQRSEGDGRGPCQTIARALHIARPADRILLAKNDQPYRESITLQGGRNSGLAHSPFRLDGNGAILDGTVDVPANQWKHVEGDTFSFRPFYLHYQQLFLGGLPAARKRIHPLAGELAELQPGEWCLYRQAIHFRTQGGKSPQQLPLRLAVLPVGITLYEVHDVQIVNLTVQGFRIDGVNAHDGVRGAVLSGLTCRGNGRSGVSIGGASRVEVVACLIGNNGEVQLRTEGKAKVQLTRCDLVPGDVPQWTVDGGQLTIDGKPAANSAEPPAAR